MMNMNFDGRIICFVLPTVFAIAITLVLIYVIYKLIRYFDERIVKKRGEQTR